MLNDLLLRRIEVGVKFIQHLLINLHLIFFVLDCSGSRGWLHLHWHRHHILGIVLDLNVGSQGLALGIWHSIYVCAHGHVVACCRLVLDTILDEIKGVVAVAP